MCPNGHQQPTIAPAAACEQAGASFKTCEHDDGHEKLALAQLS
jgi:hypothetical protein